MAYSSINTCGYSCIITLHLLQKEKERKKEYKRLDQ